MPKSQIIFDQIRLVHLNWLKKIGYPGFLLSMVILSVTVFAVRNSVLIYDDLFYPTHLRTLLDTKGNLTPLYILFNLDLPSEYRTYGLSRILQLLIIIFTGGTSSVFYAFFISLSQGLSGAAIYILLRRYSTDEVQALMLAILWICSPFVWMNCFHHYSYIILPYQISIFLALFASTFASSGIHFHPFKKNGLIALMGGAAIALTGEAHIIAAFTMLFFVVISMKNSQLNKWLFMLAISSVLTIIIHFLVWKAIGQNSNLLPRFSVDTLDPMVIWNRLIRFKFSLLEGLDNQISSVYSRSKGFSGVIASGLITAGIWLSTWKSSSFNFLSTHTKNYGSTTDVHRISGYILTTFFVISVASLVVYAITLLSSGAIMNLFPRRYGAVPYTLFAMLVVATIPFVVGTGLSGKIIQSILFAAIVSLFWQLQIQILPIIRSEDKAIANLIKTLAQSKKFDAIIFQNRFDPSFPTIHIDSGTPGLRGGGVLDEIIESPFSSYWTQANYTRNIIGMQNGGTFQRVSDSSVIPITIAFDAASSMEANRPVPVARIAVIQNTSLDQSRSSLRNVRLYENWNDYQNARFSSRIEKASLLASVGGGKSFSIDIGNKLTNSTNESGPDKVYGVPMYEGSLSNIFVKQYGFAGGFDSVYTIPNGGSNIEYYKTNRNGDFVYRIDFKTGLDVVKVRLDFWEMWGRIIGERKFAIDLQLAGGWVEVGEIDPAQIAEDMPFSVVLSLETPKTLSVRFRKIAGSIDVPVLQGIRISK